VTSTTSRPALAHDVLQIPDAEGFVATGARFDASGALCPETQLVRTLLREMQKTTSTWRS